MNSAKRILGLVCRFLPFLLLSQGVFGGLSIPTARGETVLKIGILEEPKTLNIWAASDGWTRKVLRQIYNPLYIRDFRTLELVPWLAEGKPIYDEASLSYTIRLRSAKWSDGSPVTAGDVVFTGNTIRNFKVPRYYASWKFIRRLEALDNRTVRFFLEKPKAIFLTRTITTPVVQERQWAKVISRAKGNRNPLSELLHHQVKRPVGTGPFVLAKWKKKNYLYLSKNPHFFARQKVVEGYPLGPHIDGIVLKMYGTTDAAVLALRKGTIDMFWWGLQPGYLEDLRETRGITIFTTDKSSLYYLGFNTRKRPFDDIHFRQAVATLINKDFIVKRILHGYAEKMNSVVPPVNRYWYCPDLPTYSDDLSKKERIRKAYRILKDSGYTWQEPPVDASGNIVQGENIILPNGEPMEHFTILTPPADYDPSRAMTGIMIQEWLRQMGMPATARPMAFGALFHKLSALHDFDLFVLGYGQLSLDPDYIRNFFHSANDTVRGWNMCGYKNADFDKIADASSNTLDFEKRKKLIWEMQKMIMRDVPYVPLYTPKHIEAVRTDRFEGWVTMPGGIGNIWSFCLIKPHQ